MYITHVARKGNLLLLLIPLHAAVNGFLLPTNIRHSHFGIAADERFHSPQHFSFSPTFSQRSKFPLHSTKTSSPPPIPNTEDPFLILGLSTPTADKKVIKRAYRRMALQYHPDVRLNASSTEEERKVANDDFAKINAAYSLLTGKDENGSSTGNGTGRSKSRKAGQYADYTPPHRRTASQTKRSASSTDWEDFMPKYDDQQYDTNGDSFSSIFSDLISELGSNAGSTSILNDLVSFLEGNFPSVGTTKQKEEDDILESLLKHGTFEEIGIELEDAKLLVIQLEGKRKDLRDELETIRKDLGTLNSYMSQMTLEEEQKEIEARMEIIEDYLQRAKLRQMKLRRRRDELKSESFSKNTRPQDRKTHSPQSRDAPREEETTWKRESFGSSGRRRGRKSTSPNSYTSTNSSYSYNNNAETSTNRQGSSYRKATQNTPSSNRQNSSYRKTTQNTPSSNSATLPPHRRATSRAAQNLEDKRRLREIKVDEEIDRMKKELGL